MHGVGWTRLTADGVVTAQPVLLHGLVLLVSTTGGDVTLYNGQDAGSGRVVGRFEAIADQSTSIPFYPPLRCENGLYVDVGSNVTELLVLWERIAIGFDNPGDLRAEMMQRGY